MKREELSGILRQPYDIKRGYGVVKGDTPGYQNIWFVVPPPPPQKLPANLPFRAIARANATLNRLPAFRDMTERGKLINYFFVRTEAIASSRMEGTWSTIDHVLTPVDTFDVQYGKSETHSVRGYAYALEKHFSEAAKKKESVFTEKLICDIHKNIVSRDPHFTWTAGALRTPGNPGGVVQIGGGFRKEDSIFNPAPPAHVRACFGKVLGWLGDKELAERGDAGMIGFTLPVRLAIGHVHFEAVHPFTDGNGRVGRALWPLQMICADRMPLYLCGFVEAHKTDYSKALQEAQKKLDYSTMIEFICEAIVESNNDACITRAALDALPARWKERAKFRTNSASFLALDVLLQKPIITTTILMDELKVSRQAVTVAINQLVERRVIRKRGHVGRTQIYAAEELICLLSRKFGSDSKSALAAGLNVLANSPG